jgi:hypothetical protein
MYLLIPYRLSRVSLHLSLRLGLSRTCCMQSHHHQLIHRMQQPSLIVRLIIWPRPNSSGYDCWQQERNLMPRWLLFDDITTSLCESPFWHALLLHVLRVFFIFFCVQFISFQSFHFFSSILSSSFFVRVMSVFQSILFRQTFFRLLDYDRSQFCSLDWDSVELRLNHTVRLHQCFESASYR